MHMRKVSIHVSLSPRNFSLSFNFSACQRTIRLYSWLLDKMDFMDP